jgi:hypothetical protein
MNLRRSTAALIAVATLQYGAVAGAQTAGTAAEPPAREAPRTALRVTSAPVETPRADAVAAEPSTSEASPPPDRNCSRPGPSPTMGPLGVLLAVVNTPIVLVKGFLGIIFPALRSCS